ncbi:MAG: acetyl-CoA carboxylase biotin carboxyl carrier protein [Chryseobacterium sp.]|nr:MAG: acetyl-CoA carboxylase biotin carboxyl carrier protein [Chryseobacterium sp.]
MDIKDIQNLIRFVAKAGVSEVKYKTKDFEINIKTQSETEGITFVPQQHQVMAAPAQLPAAPQAQQAQPEAPAAGNAEDESKYVAIKSPMIGTFYRKPSPDKPSFINVGDDVKSGTVVCVIEAMKLFNQIESEVSGKIVKILVDDASPVEYDQPLFLVDPS